MEEAMTRWMWVCLVVGCGGSTPKSGETGDTATVATGGTSVTTTTTTTTTLPAGGLAVSFVPYTLLEGDNVLDTRVFDLGEGVQLPEERAEVDAGSGVLLTGSVADLHAPDFMPEATWVGAVQVPEKERLPVELNGEVLGMWYMGPFDYHADAALGVRLTGITEPDAKAKDASYELWVARYETSLWERVGAATFDKNGVSIDGDLSLVSSLVLMDVTGVTEQPDATKGSGEAALTGTVLNPDGTPYEGGRVQFCRDGECVTSTTDSEGQYEMDGLGVGRGSFEVIPVQ